MMKSGWMWMALIALSLGAIDVHAEKANYGMAGCGLGSLVVSPEGPQLIASTTNTTSYSTPFGISSGTSNCIPSGQSYAEYQQEDFFYTNYATLSKEMAQGSGKSLESLGELLGCPNDLSGRFGQFTQKKYDVVFSAPGAVAAWENLKSELRQDGAFSSRCIHLAAQDAHRGTHE